MPYALCVERCLCIHTKCPIKTCALCIFSWFTGRIWNWIVCRRRRRFRKWNRFSLFSSPVQFWVKEKKSSLIEPLYTVFVSKEIEEKRCTNSECDMKEKLEFCSEVSIESCLESGLIETTKEPLCIQSAFERMTKLQLHNNVHAMKIASRTRWQHENRFRFILFARLTKGAGFNLLLFAIFNFCNVARMQADRASEQARERVWQRVSKQASGRARSHTVTTSELINLFGSRAILYTLARNRFAYNEQLSVHIHTSNKNAN